jgi:oxygen-independent coproporphyrinogen-3 oxidase
VADTRALVLSARAQGIDSINFDLIYGLPHQSIERFDRTLDTVIDLEPDRLAVYGYAHLPEIFKAQSVIDASTLPSAETRLDLLGRTIERLTAAGYVHIGMDHFAKPGDELAVAQRDGSLQRNFQGYTTHGGCDLVAFGISAIGTVGDLYSQNEKLEEAYFEAIDAGRLPIVRGLVMDPDDRIRRAVIGELMCFGRVWYRGIEEQFGIDFRDYFAASLAKLEQAERDGLVVIGEDRLEITATGAMLLRIVAMAFDAYLDGGKSAVAAAARYSRVL